jgi:predicted nucleotidyltransferase
MNTSRKPADASARDVPELPTAVLRMIGRLYRVFQAQSVVLFGSYARGEQTPRSDIDLLVVLPDDQLEEAERRRGQLVSGLFPSVDLVWTTPRELAEARGERAAFLRSVIEHGVEQSTESAFSLRPGASRLLATSTKPDEERSPILGHELRVDLPD